MFLRDYQYKAVDDMHNGCILNGDTGTGKSRTGLYYYFKNCGGSIIEKYNPMTHPIDLYIITTAKKRDSLEWEHELSNYLLSTDPEVCYYKSIKVVIDSWNNIGKYREVKNSFIIFDEDRVIGKGSWVKSFLKMAKNNWWIILSATPGDTWSDYIPVFIANGFYQSRTEFNYKHVVMARYSKWPKVEKYLNVGRLIRLRNQVLVKMETQRSTVQHHETVWAEYNREDYKKARKDRWDYILNEPIETASGLYNCLRRIVNSDPSRLQIVSRILNDKKKAIIFYNFNFERDLLKELFKDSCYDVAEWNGHAHQEVPNSDQWVYLTQYIAGSEGWNCIRTNTIIFYSESYSYRMMTQAAGRIDRMNTSYVDLYYYHIKSHSDIDLAISKALEQKKDFNKRKYFDKVFS